MGGGGEDTLMSFLFHTINLFPYIFLLLFFNDMFKILDQILTILIRMFGKLHCFGTSVCDKVTFTVFFFCPVSSVLTNIFFSKLNHAYICSL